MDGQDNEATNNASEYLGPEHDTWWNFHVVAEFEISCEGAGLRCAEVAVGFEHHACDGTARKDVTNHQLRKDVKGEGLVGDGLNDTSWNGIDKRNDEGQDKSPNWCLRSESMRNKLQKAMRGIPEWDKLR